MARFQEKQDFRNYDKEARDMISELRGNELYRMYEIVVNQLQRSNSETRDKELNAVKKAIETVPGIDKARLLQMIKGYKSSMAHTARAKDGNTRPNRKKV